MPLIADPSECTEATCCRPGLGGESTKPRARHACDVQSHARVTEAEIAAGLRRLGLDRTSDVIVHSSLSSFGQVDGGAEAVGSALVRVCGTVMVPAGSWDLTGVGAPPGLARPMNAFEPCATWEEFDKQLAGAVQFSPDTPIDRWLGVIPETMRLTQPHRRSTHPLFSYLAVGRAAEQLVGSQTMDHPLAPIETLGMLGGQVLLLGVTHTSNTTIHLAEQQLGRSRFYRYAKAGPGVWMELPNISGESHRFGRIEPALSSATRTTQIGACLARLVPIAAVLAVAQRLIRADPGALLCRTTSCRCWAAYEQRLAAIEQR